MAETTTRTKEAAATAASIPNQSTAMTAPAAQPAIAIIDGVEVPTLIRERDDEAMLAAFMGEVVETWFYEFEIQGKKIEGVGVIGAHEFARIQAEKGCPITTVPYGVQVVEAERNGERGVQATVIMRDARTRREAIGIAFYPYMLKKRDGSKAYDDKADRKAVSVAERNAILDLIPQEEILAVLKTRKLLIAKNNERLAEVRQRAIAAAPTVTAVYDRTTRDPYEQPTPLQSHRAPQQPAAGATVAGAGKKASEEQIAQLLDLTDDARVDEKTRAHIKARLTRGISEQTALKWIADLERAFPAEHDEDSDELPLSKTA